MPEIVEQTLCKGQVLKRLTYQEPAEVQAIPSFKDLPFSGKQVRIALVNCGVVDPERIDDYIVRDGYAGLGKVLAEMSPDDVIREVRTQDFAAGAARAS